ncbi:MAG: hypothetical protein HFJ80_04750 [Clostridiales bacterium]|nr:hypothetical protein [Clostridiales bacterium]
MLGKLLKYEVKAGLRLFPIIYLAGLLPFLLGLLAKVLNIQQVQGLMVAILALASFASVVGVIIFAIVRYFKGLFGAEGYLNQTLPVSKGSLIGSRIIAAGIWMAVGVGMALLGISGVQYLIADDPFALWKTLEELTGTVSGALLLYLGAAMLVQTLALIGELYFAMTLANTRSFVRNNALFSVLFYFAASTVVGFLELVGILLIPIGMQLTEQGMELRFEMMLSSIHLVEQGLTGVTMGLGSILVDLVAGVGLLLAARLLMEHKLTVK